MMLGLVFIFLSLGWVEVDSRQLKIESRGNDPTPRSICVNAVDKGDRGEFGVKAVDKGLRDET